VALIEGVGADTTVRRFVQAHHYSGTMSSARVRFGLFEHGDLVGCAVFGDPRNYAALKPWSKDTALDLGRFVLLDRVPGNAESWFIARCLDHLRAAGYAGVVSLSDPQPRTTCDGDVVFPGHVGTIYQASNALYVGKTRGDYEYLFSDGTSFFAGNLSKIRSRAKGWRYATEQLVAHGAEPPPPGDLRAWLERELVRVTRKVKHLGKHRYLFPLVEAAARDVERAQREGAINPTQAYPRAPSHGACEPTNSPRRCFSGPVSANGSSSPGRALRDLAELQDDNGEAGSPMVSSARV
jgi:hypothetical protein